ncbi:hypothetical protein IIC44_00995 [Patescibacteria group bacterium]|nr:hypothetical protein [Patescibacteria group bacterium]
MKFFLSFVVILYFFALLQTSFLPHFFSSGFIPNLIIITVVISSFFKKYEVAFIGGFFLDLFSQMPFGFWTVSLVALALLLQILITRYVQNPIFQFRG